MSTGERELSLGSSWRDGMIFASGCEPPPVEGPINVSDEEAEAAAAMEYSQNGFVSIGHA